MRIRPVLALLALVTTVLGASLLGSNAAAAPETFQIDPVHSTIIFRTKHLNAGHVYGRFDEFSGTVTVDDANLAAAKVEVSVKAQSLNTGNAKRDEHLRSPDFFAVAQFPTITFTSTSVKKAGDGYEVSGNLTLHGATKSVTVRMQRLGQGTNQEGKTVVGYEGTLDLKRSDYGMTKMVGPVSDEVRLILAFETSR
jgi:polyisoprenoid-binding protein YceI